MQAYEAEGKTLVYLDESGFAQDMPRTHGYALSGKRCYGVHNWQAKGRINAIGAIVGMKFLTVALFENTQQRCFLCWVDSSTNPRIT